MLYKILCYIRGDNKTFPVNIDAPQIVGDLKDQIKIERSDWNDVVAAELTLHRAQVDDTIAKQKQTRITELQRLSLHLDECFELKDEELVSEVFGDIPEKTRYYCIVVPPAALPSHGIEHTQSGGSDSHPSVVLPEQLIPLITFRLLSPTSWKVEDVEECAITESETEPTYIESLREELSLTRRVLDTNNAEKLMPHFTELGTFSRYFRTNTTVSDPLQKVADSEAVNYRNLFLATMLDRDCFNHNRKAHMHCLLYPLVQHAQRIGKKAHLHFGRLQDFHLIAKLPASNIKPIRRYQPKSDISLCIERVPHLVLEIMSCPDNSDRNRMLIQAACMARLGNALRVDREHPFTVSAIYINQHLEAEWHYVYQPSKLPDVEYVKETFDLTNAMTMFDFVFRLYNFVSLAKNYHEALHNPFDAVRELNWKVLWMGYDALTSRKRKTRDDDEGGGGPKKRQNKSGGTGNSTTGQNDGGLTDNDILFDMAIEKALLAGYTIPEEVEGFESLLPLNANMLEAVSVHGEPVILKFTDRHEVDILRRLHAKPSTKKTHIISLLDVVDGRLLVLPLCIPLLLFLELNALVGDVELLALQFLEGVAYLQLSSVAHLDLKPGNIVVKRDRKSKTVDLNIIDFDISVFADAQATISRSSGTDGWSAPEVLAGKPYNPLLADRWSCGRVLVFFMERMKPNRVRETMRLCSQQLMDLDPSLRPRVADVVSLCQQEMGRRLTTTTPFPVSHAPQPKT